MIASLPASAISFRKVDEHEKDLRLALKKYNVPDIEFWLLGFGEGTKCTLSIE